MSALIELLPFILAALAALGGGLWLRQSGKKAEQADQAKREKKARDIAKGVENDVAKLPGDKAKEELKRW